MEPTILYEDANILVINKPSGLVVHDDGHAKEAGKIKEKNLVDWILKNYPQIKDVGEPGRTANGETVLRSGIVHRLDRETSGVMMIAKNQETFEFLKDKFKNHNIEKTYHAFVYGQLKKTEDVIDRPIGRSSKDFRMWSAQRGARGELREAETHYKVLKSNKDYSFVEVKPKTGRTHQIRVHFKAISYPLVADSVYAPNRENNLGFVRLALHSYCLSFADQKGDTHTIVAPYPADFANALDLLQSY
ncbi:MAG: RluA family pseudouridine synthase [Parcubacteria group bacterium]